MKVTWADGIERAPDGAPAREIPQPFTWNSSLWITDQGVAYRRYYNAIARAHTWEALNLCDDDTGRWGYHVPAFATVEHAIALAWRARAPDSRARVRTLDARQPPSADNVVWGEEERELESCAPPETWSKLEWSIGLVPCDGRYEISSKGRLRAPHGAVTRGHWCHGTRWAAVRGAGLVDLLAAAHLAPNALTLPPRLGYAYRAAEAGLTPPEYALATRIPEKRAWLHGTQVLPFLRNAKDLVARDVRRVLEGMRDDPTLGGPLTPLYEKVAPRMPRELSMDELRHARTALVR